MRDTLAAIFIARALLGVPALVLTGTFELPQSVAVFLAGGPLLAAAASPASAPATRPRS